MTVKPNIIITITTTDGKTLVGRGAADVRIFKSMHSFVNTATVQLPASSRMTYTKTGNTASGQTAKQFNRGDKIQIELGYGNETAVEFVGFITRINFTIPCEVECEGFSYQLRHVAPVKSWKTVKLKTVLQELIKDTDITIHQDVQDIELKPFYMGTHSDNKTAFQVLQKLVKTKVLVAYFINETQLYVGLKNLAVRDNTVIHKLGYNTINEHELKYRRREDVKLHVAVTYIDEKGKTKNTTAGEKGGIELNFNYGRLSTADKAKVQALRDAEKYRYEGYEGKIVTFLIPHCQPGWRDDIRDPEYNERSQIVILESVEIRANRAGGRRILEVGQKINTQA